MLTGISLTFMEQTAQPLPLQFLLQGYRITSLQETTELYHLYQAVSPDGRSVLIREFCPQGVTRRQEGSCKLAFSAADIQTIAQSKSNFQALYEQDAQLISDLGTIFYVYDEAQQMPVVATRQRASSVPQLSPAERAAMTGANGPHDYKPKKAGAGFMPLVVLGLAAVVVYLGWQIINMEPPPPPPVVKKDPPPKPPAKIKYLPITENETPPPPEEPAPEVVEVDEPEEEPEPDYSASEDLQKLEREVMLALGKNKGKINEVVINAYAKYAEKYIREYLELRGSRFSPAFEKWMKDTGHQKEIFANFYPPDPSVATNADILINAVGEKAWKYDQLVIAFAVGRRQIGMGSFDLGKQGKFLSEYINAASASKGWGSPADLFIAGQPPINFYGVNPGSVDYKAYNVVAAYLTNKNLTPKQAWVNKEDTIKNLADQGISEKNLASLLQEHLYRTRQVRRKRDAFPQPADFFLYLVSKYENINKIRDVNKRSVEWKGVPLDFTPWLAMLPLSETRPIRECEYVWDRYLGKYGEPRIWFYGPYRRDDDPEPPVLFSMDPSPDWSYDAYPSCIYVGGVCGTMSLIARDASIALGIPTPPAGQPGHGNLMTFHYNANGSILTVDQSVDTLKVTTGPLYLRDTTTKRAGYGEYHVGLAASMNLNDNDWMDSRLAMNVYKMAKEKEAPEAVLEVTLKEVLRLNPFFTDAWYMLFARRGEDLKAAIACVEDINKAIPEGNSVSKLWQRKKSGGKMGKTSRNYRDRLNNQAHEYTDTLSSALIELAMEKPLPNYTKREWEKVLDWMRNRAKKSIYPDMEQGYQIALAKTQGYAPIMKSVDKEFESLVREVTRKSKTRRRAKKSPEDIMEQLTLEINAAVMVLPQEESVPWLRKMIDESPAAIQYKRKDNGAKITDFYDCLTKHYIRLANNQLANEVRTLMKQQEQDFLAKMKAGELEES